MTSPYFNNTMIQQRNSIDQGCIMAVGDDNAILGKKQYVSNSPDPKRKKLRGDHNLEQLSAVKHIVAQ